MTCFKKLYLQYAKSRNIQVDESLLNYEPSKIIMTARDFEAQNILMLPLFRQVFTNPYLQQINEQCVEELRQIMKDHQIESQYLFK